MKIKILKIEPGKKPEIKEIEDGLKSLQDEVQGDIEAVYPFDDNVGIICNEEGKINGMHSPKKNRLSIRSTAGMNTATITTFTR